MSTAKFTVNVFGRYWVLMDYSGFSSSVAAVGAVEAFMNDIAPPGKVRKMSELATEYIVRIRSEDMVPTIDNIFTLAYRFKLDRSWKYEADSITSLGPIEAVKQITYPQQFYYSGNDIFTLRLFTNYFYTNNEAYGGIKIIITPVDPEFPTFQTILGSIDRTEGPAKRC